MFNPYVLLGAAGLVLAAFLSGAYSGYKYEHRKFEAYKQQVAVVAAQKEAENISVKKQQDLISKGIANEYEAKIAAIRNYYADRVRNPNASGSSLSPISPTTIGIDGKATNLELACAYTTQQLVSLQDWVRDQVSVK